VAVAQRPTCTLAIHRGRSTRSTTPYVQERVAAAASVVGSPIVDHGFSPTLAEVGAALNAAEPTVHYYLILAEHLGLVRRHAFHRGWEPLDDGAACVTCGQPVRAVS
jgi:hypothetical protein